MQFFIAFDIPMKLVWLNTYWNKMYNEVCIDNIYTAILKQVEALWHHFRSVQVQQAQLNWMGHYFWHILY